MRDKVTQAHLENSPKGILISFILLLFLPFFSWAQNSGFGDPIYLGNKEVSDISKIETVNINWGDNSLEDIVVFGEYHIGWYENMGSGTFSSYRPISTTSEPIFVSAAGDIDNDGDVDIVWLKSSEQRTLFIALNNGSGTSFEIKLFEMEKSISGPAHMAFSEVWREGVKKNRLFIKSVYDALRNENDRLLELWVNNESELVIERLPVARFSSNYIFKVVDLNRDDKEDFIFLSMYWSTDLILYISNSDTSYNLFGVPEDIQIPSVTSPQILTGVITSDIQNDGDIDIVYSSRSNTPYKKHQNYGYLYWAENISDTTFADPVIMDSLIFGYNTIHKMDVDNDGLEDVVGILNGVRNAQAFGDHSDGIYWYRRKTSGMFEHRKLLSQPKFPFSNIAISDLDGDQDQDIVGSSKFQISWLKRTFGAEFEAEKIIDESSVGVINQLKSADLDRDGLPDLVSGSLFKGKGVSWMKNQGNSFIFSEPKIIDDEIANVQAIELLDIDKDGDLDILALSSHFYREEIGFQYYRYADYKIVWYKNSGGHFGERQLLVNSAYSEDFISYLSSFSAGDFDGDGDLDLAIHAIDHMFWFENEGDLNFSKKTEFAQFDISNEFLTFSTSANFDNSVQDELIAGYTSWMEIKQGEYSDFYEAPILKMYTHNPDSGFYPFYQYKFSGSGFPVYSTSGDLNQDGFYDMVFACTNFTGPQHAGAGNFKIVWLSQTESDTVWSEYIVSDESFDFTGVTAADFDLDGRLDVASANIRRIINLNNTFRGYAEGTIKWYHNSGDTIFVRSAPIDTLQPQAQHLLAEDFNNDGWPDLITYIGGDGTIAIYPNQFLELNIENPVSDIPATFTLEQNYPNPFNPSTVISYQVPVNSEVRLEVFDLLGRKVATLEDDNISAGTHKIRFDASHLASGMYIYRLKAGDTIINKKMMLIK